MKANDKITSSLLNDAIKNLYSTNYFDLIEIEYSSDEEFDLSCLYKKKEEKKKDVKTTKNQKKILKQHKYMKYMESKNKKYKEAPKKCSLENFFQQSKRE